MSVENPSFENRPEKKINIEYSAIDLDEHDLDMMGQIFKRPEVKEKIKSAYKKIKLENGISLTIDQAPPQENEILNGELIRYFRGEKWKQDIERLNTVLPPDYKKADLEKLPPIFIHGTEMKNLIAPDTEGFVEGDWRTPKNINLNRTVRDYDMTAIHELIHTLEPKNKVKWKYLEGVTRLTEFRTFDVDLHTQLLKELAWYKTELQNRGKAEHPMIEGFEQGNLNLKNLIADAASKDRAAEKEQGWGKTIARYSLCASFLDWYEKNRGSLDQLRYGNELSWTNYNEILKQIQAVFPTKTEVKTIKDNKGNERKMPEIISTLPPGFRGIDEFDHMAVSDNDPLVIAYKERIESEVDNDKKVQLYYELRSAIDEKVGLLQKEYSDFLKAYPDRLA